MSTYKTSKFVFGISMVVYVVECSQILKFTEIAPLNYKFNWLKKGFRQGNRNRELENHFLRTYFLCAKIW